MVDIIQNSYKSMLLGIEVSLVAVFGLVFFESRLSDIWITIMIVGLLITFVGVIQPAPEK